MIDPNAPVSEMTVRTKIAAMMLQAMIGDSDCLPRHTSKHSTPGFQREFQAEEALLTADALIEAIEDHPEPNKHRHGYAPLGYDPKTGKKLDGDGPDILPHGAVLGNYVVDSVIDG